MKAQSLPILPFLRKSQKSGFLCKNLPLATRSISGMGQTKSPHEADMAYRSMTSVFLKGTEHKPWGSVEADFFAEGVPGPEQAFQKRR